MVDLAFAEYGPGDDGTGGAPLIVLHGLFGSARNWTRIARELSANHHVYTLDLRNHGTSPRTPSMSYAEMAADVADFIAAHGIADPVVMGHSMGGKVAMELALEQPTLPRALIVVDIAPVPYGHDRMDYVAAMQALDLAATGRRSEIEDVLRAQVDDPGIAAFLMTNLERAGDGFQWRINLPAISASMTDLVGFDPPPGAVYRRPALFVAGDRSAYIREDHKARIAELFPRARVVTLKDAAHWVHADQPEAFVSTVQAFLGAVEKV